MFTGKLHINLMSVNSRSIRSFNIPPGYLTVVVQRWKIYHHVRMAQKKRSTRFRFKSVTIYVMTVLNVLSSKLSDPTRDLLLLVRGMNLQTLPKISFGNLSLIDKVDSEQKDFYLLGDLNCNLHDGSNHNSSTLTNILDIYGLSQLISEPTRITPTSSTLIDLCITSSPEKISKAGVAHLGISDHSLVFMTLKICYERTSSHRTIETRAFKNF